MKKILLVEDDAFIRDLVSSKLAQNSYDVESVTTAEEASEYINEHTPDLIILDLELPGMQGTEFLKKLRHDTKQSDMPVVVFSNNDEPEVKEECNKFGISGFFVKINTDLDEFVVEINSLLS